MVNYKIKFVFNVFKVKKFGVSKKIRTLGFSEKYVEQRKLTYIFLSNFVTNSKAKSVICGSPKNE